MDMSGNGHVWKCISEGVNLSSRSVQITRYAWKGDSSAEGEILWMEHNNDRVWKGLCSLEEMNRPQSLKKASVEKYNSLEEGNR